jgi:ferrous iron transport protein B
MNTNAAQLGSELSKVFTPLTAFSFLVFSLLYTPCVAAVSTMKKELHSGITTLGIVIMQCIIAWLAAYVFYQAGGFLLKL